MSRYAFSAWMNSAGGPLVLMEAAHAFAWSGIDGTPSDYDRACRVGAYLGILESGMAPAVVLGDEPLQTCVATDNHDIALVRWKWADHEDAIKEAVKTLDLRAAIPIETAHVTWTTPTLVMFDAAGCFVPECAFHFTITPGHYAVKTFVHSPKANLSLLIHAMLRA